jgi:hypothetical protein
MDLEYAKEFAENIGMPHTVRTVSNGPKFSKKEERKKLNVRLRKGNKTVE